VEGQERIGKATAELMDDLDAEGYPDDTKIVGVLVVVEVETPDSSYTHKRHDATRAMASGLAVIAHHLILDG
jgi:hypothetical protein